MSSGLAVEIQAVSKRFGATSVLDGVDLTVPAGQFLSVIGPSGCGKTTLLRLMAGLAEANEGTVTLGGASPRAAQTARQLGFVPQSPGLLPWRTVRANARLLTDVGRHRGGLAAATRSTACSARSGSVSSLARTPTSCPVACSNGWPWCGRSPSTLRSC